MDLLWTPESWFGSETIHHYPGWGRWGEGSPRPALPLLIQSLQSRPHPHIQPGKEEAGSSLFSRNTKVLLSSFPCISSSVHWTETIIPEWPAKHLLHTARKMSFHKTSQLTQSAGFFHTEVHWWEGLETKPFHCQDSDSKKKILFPGARQAMAGTCALNLNRLSPRVWLLLFLLAQTRVGHTKIAIFTHD